MDVKTKELSILKLLNHILQPTMYDDIREIAREWAIEENKDKYLVKPLLRPIPKKKIFYYYFM